MLAFLVFFLLSRHLAEYLPPSFTATKFIDPSLFFTPLLCILFDSSFSLPISPIVFIARLLPLFSLFALLSPTPVHFYNSSKLFITEPA